MLEKSREKRHLKYCKNSNVFELLRFYVENQYMKVFDDPPHISLIIRTAKSKIIGKIYLSKIFVNFRNK